MLGTSHISLSWSQITFKTLTMIGRCKARDKDSISQHSEAIFLDLQASAIAHITHIYNILIYNNNNNNNDIRIYIYR